VNDSMIYRRNVYPFTRNIIKMSGVQYVVIRSLY